MVKKRRTALFGLVAASGVIGSPGLAAAMRDPDETLPATVYMAAQSTCQISFVHQTFSLPADQESMVAALRKLRKHWRALSISGPAQTPYKCIGGAIYLAQSSGFQTVQFKAQTEGR
ncbi:hypothetical protein FHT00_000984 [Sphingomonas insulae]|uniref:UrcA family protein n=1 Tax=Sphingomonas insulae TaxID=424800 RepID=A0ABP3SY32_9SPHN|nr:hypothetical protein [Sphingomonas insulae]NIJ29051.1 hypothetical protein [Sphingomonas insulae]